MSQDERDRAQGMCDWLLYAADPKGIVAALERYKERQRGPRAQP